MERRPGLVPKTSDHSRHNDIVNRGNDCCGVKLRLICDMTSITRDTYVKLVLMYPLELSSQIVFHAKTIYRDSHIQDLGSNNTAA